MSHLPPHLLAQADQHMTAADNGLTHTLEKFNEHTAFHDGDHTCSFAKIIVEALALIQTGQGLNLAYAYAAALTRLSKAPAAHRDELPPL